jgi:phage shock protein E
MKNKKSNISKSYVRNFMGILSFLFGMQQPAQATEKVTELSGPFVIIDVRTSEEYSSGHLKEAKNIDVTSSTFKDQILKLDKNLNYKVYCRSGNRSSRAEKQMKDLGFSKVENVGGVSQASKKLNIAIEPGS